MSEERESRELKAAAERLGGEERESNVNEGIRCKTELEQADGINQPMKRYFEMQHVAAHA